MKCGQRLNETVIRFHTSNRKTTYPFSNSARYFRISYINTLLISECLNFILQLSSSGYWMMKSKSFISTSFFGYVIQHNYFRYYIRYSYYDLINSISIAVNKQKFRYQCKKSGHVIVVEITIL